MTIDNSKLIGFLKRPLKNGINFRNFVVIIITFSGKVTIFAFNYEEHLLMARITITLFFNVRTEFEK